MPIYEYRCSDCHHELEVLQKMRDEAIVDCPQCGKPSLVKIISAVAFRLAGSGWYETDFKSDNKKNLAGDAAQGADKNKGEKPAKTDSVVESKTTEKSTVQSKTQAASKASKTD